MYMLFFLILLYIPGNVSFCVCPKAKMEVWCFVFFLDKEMVLCIFFLDNGNGALYLLKFFSKQTRERFPAFSSNQSEKYNMMIVSYTLGPR